MKSKPKLRLDPINIDGHNWYYEEAKGLCFAHEVHDSGKHLRTDMWYVPWKYVLESVRRKYGVPIK